LDDSLLAPSFFPSEASLTTTSDGTMYLVGRRNGVRGAAVDAVMGLSEPPYTSWEFRQLPVSIESPSMLTLENDAIILAGRRRDHSHMSVMEFLPEQTNVRTFATLNPSGGDFAYPGLCWYDAHLCISHYHARSTSDTGKIYFTAMKAGVPVGG